MSPVSVKVGGVWKDAPSVYTKVGGDWKTAADMPVKVGGVWKTGILSSGAFEPIATATGTGSSSTITFSSIPSTYQHLQIKVLGRTTSTSSLIKPLILWVNGVNTGTSYARHLLWGTGSAVSVGGAADQPYWDLADALGTDYYASGLMGVSIIDIHDYASTSKYKTMRALSGCDTNNTTGKIWLSSGLYKSTSAITSISLNSTNNFTTDSTFALYGIKGA